MFFMPCVIDLFFSSIFNSEFLVSGVSVSLLDVHSLDTSVKNSRNPFRSDACGGGFTQEEFQRSRIERTQERTNLLTKLLLVEVFLGNVVLEQLAALDFPLIGVVSFLNPCDRAGLE